MNIQGESGGRIQKHYVSFKHGYVRDRCEWVRWAASPCFDWPSVARDVWTQIARYEQLPHENVRITVSRIANSIELLYFNVVTSQKQYQRRSRASLNVEIALKKHRYVDKR